MKYFFRQAEPLSNESLNNYLQDVCLMEVATELPMDLLRQSQEYIRIKI